MEFDAEFYVLLGFVVFVGVLIYVGAPRMLLKALDARGEAIAAEMVDSGPAAIRGRVRDWLSPRVAGLSLDEPTDWSDWDPQRRQ